MNQKGRLNFLPLFFKATDLACLVVGGGEVASRKVDMLLDIGSALTVIAPEITSTIREAVDGGLLRWQCRKFRAGDCDGFQLVIAATQHREVNRAVYQEAVRIGVPVNVVDDPELCTVIFPALWRKGSLTFAISTGGEAPFMAAALRNRVREAFPHADEWVKSAGRFRSAVRKEAKDSRTRDQLYRAFADAIRADLIPDTPESDSLQDWIDWLQKHSKGSA